MFKSILRENRRYIILTSIFLILSSLLMVYAGYSLSFLMRAFENKDKILQRVIVEAIKVLSIWGLALVGLYINKIIQANTMRKIKNSLRKQLSINISNMDYKEYNSKDTGNYISWFTSDIDHIAEKSFIKIFKMLESIATAIFAFLLLAKLNIYIALSAIAIFFIVSVGPSLLGNRLNVAAKELTMTQEKFVESIKDILMGFNILNLYNQKNLIKEKIFKESEKIEDKKFNYEKQSSLINIIVTGFSIIGQIFILSVTIFLTIKGLAPIGSVLAVGNLAQIFLGALGSLIELTMSISATKEVFNKYQNNKEDKIKQDINEIKNLNEIEIKNLNYNYGDKEVLKNFNCKFEKGKNYAIVGESGSGKTTIAKILLSYYNDYRGTILYNDRLVESINKEDLYKKITYIDQDVYLFGTSIRNNITLGEEYTDEEVFESVKKANLDKFIKNVEDGLEFLIKENGKNISGGEKQRIALARAFIRNIPIIIMDEGTSALDKKNREEIEMSLIKDKDITLIMISHNLSEDVKRELDCIVSL